jgi:hypothetical protein
VVAVENWRYRNDCNYNFVLLEHKNQVRRLLVEMVSGKKLNLAVPSVLMVCAFEQTFSCVSLGS